MSGSAMGRGREWRYPGSYPLGIRSTSSCGKDDKSVKLTTHLVSSIRIGLQEILPPALTVLSPRNALFVRVERNKLFTNLLHAGGFSTIIFF
jgi:hypothetical protein